MRLIAVLVSIALCASALQAQGPTQVLPPVAPPGSAPTPPIYSGRQGQLRVAPPRLDQTITVDGRLDEPVWRDAALLSGFTRYFPNDGEAAVDSTEVYVWYSPTALHVGIRAQEPHGDVRATLADRDRIGSDDRLELLLGTLNDGRQALVFEVNPLGIQADGSVVETGRAERAGREAPDLSQDFVWQSKGRLVEGGYEVELRIPFKSIPVSYTHLTLPTNREV